MNEDEKTTSKAGATKSIADFLHTKRSKEELATALAVLREFKACESGEEYLGIPFLAWAKLEQFEEFLAHLAEEAPLKPDTVRHLKINVDGSA